STRLCSVLNPSRNIRFSAHLRNGWRSRASKLTPFRRTCERPPAVLSIEASPYRARPSGRGVPLNKGDKSFSPLQKGESRPARSAAAGGRSHVPILAEAAEILQTMTEVPAPFPLPSTPPFP